jgi:hypothetical protein
MKRWYGPITTCSDCGKQNTMTYILTTQGFSKTISVAASENRPHRCKECASKARKGKGETK